MSVMPLAQHHQQDTVADIIGQQYAFDAQIALQVATAMQEVTHV